MDIQAFNKDTNKIRTEDEYGQILWEDIKYIKPIIIIDEPQKIEGTKRNKSKSLRAIGELQSLFTLRYSATHKQLYNQIYKLDSYGAYQKDLVKRIEVKTVHGVIPKDYPYIRYLAFTSDLKAKIEIFSQEQGGIMRGEYMMKCQRHEYLKMLMDGTWNQYLHDVDEECHREMELAVNRIMEMERLSENSNGVKFSPTDNEKIDVNCQYISCFDTENYNKNGIESHQALVFGQSVEGVTEQLKSENPMEWVRRVNGIKVRVEKEIVNQLI